MGPMASGTGSAAGFPCLAELTRTTLAKLMTSADLRRSLASSISNVCLPPELTFLKD